MCSEEKDVGASESDSDGPDFIMGRTSVPQHKKKRIPDFIFEGPSPNPGQGVSSKQQDPPDSVPEASGGHIVGRYAFKRNFHHAIMSEYVDFTFCLNYLKT